MSAGGRRNGTRKYGHSGTQAGRHSARYTGELSTAQHKTTRRAIKIVPVAAVAATLAAGTAAYGLTANGQANPAKLDAALSAPMVLSAISHGVATPDAAKTTVLAPGANTPGAGAQTRGPSASQPVAQPSRPAAAPAATQPAVTQASQAPPAATTAPSSPSASASSTPAASTVSCSTSSSLLPANVTAIVTFLLANGYSHNAAAGIAGNIYQESKGDPESIGMGGGGLIGWTPLPSGFVTGNVPADLQAQLSALLTYNNGWSGYIPALNAAATPADAAYIYVTDFERAGIPAASTREASAEAVASACNL